MDQAESTRPAVTEFEPAPLSRTAVGGVLMGLANLVPGISGGTMIVIVGLYDEFVTSIADATRLRFSKRNLWFLGVLGIAALLAIVSLAGTLSRAVTLHRGEMFSLFIGMTLGGVPLLARMLHGPSKAAVSGAVLGFALMVAVAMTATDPPDKLAAKEAVAAGRFVVAADYGRDVAAGALGMSAMVLPGISGAYMLLILGRYETILAAISQAKQYVLSVGREGDPAVFMSVIVPVAVGSILSLILLTNFLKWMLERHRELTIGVLLGIVFGSVLGIWPFSATSSFGEYILGAVLCAL